MNRFPATMALAALALVPAACNVCGADEERAITVGVIDSLSITRGGRTARLQINSRVADAQLPPAAFDAVFDAVEDGDGSQAVVLTLGGIDPVTDELITIAFALPPDMDRGDQYTIAGTFFVEPGLSTDPGLWGTRPLKGQNSAEIAFTTSTYSFPPPQHTITYRAGSATGTIAVTARGRGHVEMTVNIQLLDATGNPAVISGRVQATTERHTPPCFS